MKPKEQRFIKIDVFFVDEISGLAMIMIIDLKTGGTNMTNVKFIMDIGFCYVTNNSLKPSILVSMRYWYSGPEIY